MALQFGPSSNHDISSHWPTFSSKECPVGRANWELHQALAIQLLVVESWIMTLKSCDYEPEKKHTNGWCGAAKRKETTTEPQQELASALCLHGELCSLWRTFVEPELCERLRWFLCDAESAGASSWELQWSQIWKSQWSRTLFLTNKPWSNSYSSYSNFPTHRNILTSQAGSCHHLQESFSIDTWNYTEKKESASGYFTINLKMTWI